MAKQDRYNFEALPEKVLQDKVFNYFKTNFNVFSEITSKCKKRRIDLLMYHNTDLNKDYPIGIELKKTSVKRGGHIGDWCNQASEYTKLEFNNHIPLIFIAPQISGWYLDEGERVAKHDVEKPYLAGAHNNVNSYLYKAHGFGEMQKFYDNKGVGNFRLVINTYIIWDSLNPTFFNIEKYKQCK
jgi:hypothetical protein